MTPNLETPDPEPAVRVATSEDEHPSADPAWDLSWDIVDQWGAQSFPASDPPANW
ncbi:MAG TPA: hypothetical protein VFI40_13890 [Nocardioides sp.]|nr:hypothetical protein [Nocardioides sp.]